MVCLCVCERERVKNNLIECKLTMYILKKPSILNIYGGFWFSQGFVFRVSSFMCSNYWENGKWVFNVGMGFC